MARADISGDVAVVAPTKAAARSAARALSHRLPGARLHPLSEAGFLRTETLLPLILAPGAGDAASRARFFDRARARLLWSAPASDLYAAIEGVITTLPRRRPRSSSAARGDLSTALLLEGEVGPDRARAALRSPVRHWIVEHPGRVKLSPRALERLRNAGVTWSALEPVHLLGVALAVRSGGSPFRKAALWRLAPPRIRRAGSPARGGRPSPR
ncbi:MAG TPA: hypothetical protein VIZ58_08115 [Thermoanaerobaculia bacterium]